MPSAPPWSPRAVWSVRLNAGGVPPFHARNLLESLGTEGLEKSSLGDWLPVIGPTKGRPDEWFASAKAFDPDAERLRADALGARLLVLGEEGYPALLSQIADPPVVLYVQGELKEADAVSVVGSRFPSPYGLRMARVLAGDCARAGLAIVSGLAHGIDAEAHRAALDAGGTTWAVLGGGLGRLYPRENAPLARRIIQNGGAVLSEMPVQAAPLKILFPRRNRIVAGLSWGTVVVEGRIQSGSRITARFAGDHGRVMMAVPGHADSPLAQAPHDLLRMGGTLVTQASEVIEALPPGLDLKPLPARGAPSPAAAVTPEEGRILALLGTNALSLNELVQLSGLDTGRISSIMFGLEIKERVSPFPGQRYAQKAAR